VKKRSKLIIGKNSLQTINQFNQMAYQPCISAYIFQTGTCPLDHPTLADWSRTRQLLNRKVDWGALMVYDDDEIDEIFGQIIPVLKPRSPTAGATFEKAVEKYNASPHKRLHDLFQNTIQKGQQAAALREKEEEFKVQARRTEKKVYRPQQQQYQRAKTRPCTSCNWFGAHSKPPYDWPAASVGKLCCNSCKSTKGRKHDKCCEQLKA
jgi:hypothetical protein